MVSESDKEFLSNFLDTNRYFDIKGCKTPKDIEKRYKRAVRLIEKALEDAEDDETERSLLSGLKVLHMMMDNQSPVTKKTAEIKKRMGVPVKRCGGQYRIFEEAKKHPNGYYANALRWGIDVAILIEKDEAIRDIFLG